MSDDAAYPEEDEQSIVETKTATMVRGRARLGLDDFSYEVCAAKREQCATHACFPCPPLPQSAALKPTQHANTPLRTHFELYVLCCSVL